MKTEQEQIEEMAKQMCGAIDNPCIHDCTPACGAREYAKRCFKAGYRKASDAIDEFVERLKEENEISFRKFGKGIGISSVFKIADEMKFELFENGQVNK